MRKIPLVLLLCLIACRAISQEVSFYLPIMDNGRIVSYTDGVPIFDDPEINSIFEDYTVNHFAKAFPLSGYEYLQKVYLIQADSIGLAQELVSYNNILFPMYEEIGEAIPLGSYYPNDWTGHWPYDTLQLSFVNAPVAWNISRGDPGTLIAVEDFYFDLSHPDMQGQYARIGVNYPHTSQPEHGTLVASLIAAKTDNNIGITGMGFNCRLVASSPGGTQSASWILSQVIDTSMGRVRVSNASYRIPTTFKKLYFLSEPPDTEQFVYNEIYERGTVAVSAAGNGNDSVRQITANDYVFPASYDHNIAVSGVGFEEENIADSAFNARYVHEFYAGDSTRSHQHNDRVDICAPSLRISGHNYDPNDPSVRYKWRGGADGGGGTSFAAPMVAGTAGLILSHRPWLTPYQVEYVLKKSSFNHYTIPYNQKYAGPTRWKGRIGAGTLDAGAALQMVDVDNFFHDHPDARTFRIKGVKITNRCVPGSHTGVPDPKLDVVMENGKPPYRYKWEAMPDNNAEMSPRLDSVGANQINATITGVTGTNPIFHYRLTVYDNSDIEKVANKVVKIQLTDEDVWDLAMQDAYADMYDEPNQMEVRSYLDWNIWESPDLWNRLTNDGGHEHQDPDTMEDPC